MTGCHLFAERLEGNAKKTIVLISGIAFIGVYGFFFAPTSSFDREVEVITFFVLFICMHLWVAVAAFLTDKDRYAFWRFNNILFIRIVISVIFSGVLFAGLALAITSINILFNVSFGEMVYLKLFFIIAGIFNTWFFLSGIPDDYEELKVEQPFPKGLKVFSQYILIPLSIIYLAILYAYGMKIVVQWDLPRGWVSALIIFYSIVGILAILLVYPLREKTEHSWVRLFARFFFIAILPLIILLYVAVYTRVNEYGVTEPRYYLIILGVWLTIISLYYIFSKRKNINLIPVSLLIFGLLSLFGPWNAFNVSENSQVKRLKKVFGKYNMLSAEGINKPDKKLTEYDTDQIRGVIYYLADHHSYQSLSKIYNINISDLASSSSERYSRWSRNSILIDTLFSMSYIDDKENRYNYYHFSARDETFSIEGYSQIHSINYWYINDADVWHLNDNTYVKEVTLIDSSALRLKYVNGDIIVKKEEEIISTIPIMKLGKKLVEIGDKKVLPIHKMSVTGNGKVAIKLVLTTVNIENNNGEPSSIEGYLLVE